MHITRREFATFAAASTLAAISTSRGSSSEEAQFFPHQVLSDASQPAKKVLVISHWHAFPISIDNKRWDTDYYTREYLNPNGEKGKYAYCGGFLRDRPIPRAPIAGGFWRDADAEADIEFGQGAGLDGFQLNIGALSANSTDIKYIKTFMKSAVGKNFHIAPCLDCYAIGKTPDIDGAIGLIAPLLRHEAALRIDGGRPMLSCFLGESWSVDQWTAILSGLKKQEIPVYFAPMFLDAKNVTDQHLAISDMIGWWAGDDPAAVSSVRKLALESRAAGKAIMHSVWPQDFRPKDLWFHESRNSETFRRGWESAIELHAECVNILTWNDYSESSHLRPSVGTQYAFSDLNRYYADWHKRGVQPKITRDTLFYFHRRDFTTPTPGDLPGAVAMKSTGGVHPSDDVELVAFLTDEGELSIINSGGTTTDHASPGIAVVRAPLAFGRQRFILTRRGSPKVEMESEFDVRSTWDWQDLTYRGGSSLRKPLFSVQRQ